MLLPEIVLELLTNPMYDGYCNLNHVLIKCPQEQKENVRKWFTEIYMSKVQDEMKKLANYHGCVALYDHDLDSSDVRGIFSEDDLDYADEKLNLIKSGDYYSTFDLTKLEKYGITITDRDDGFLIKYGVPVYTEVHGFRVEYSQAVEYSLEKLVKQFPDVKYYGYEGFFSNDPKGGESGQYEFYSSKEEIPVPDDYIGHSMRWVDWEEALDIYDNIGKQKIGAGMNQFGGRFYVVFSGPIKDYKENKVKKKIDGLKKVGTFSSLNFFGANNTVDENIKPEEYGYYTFDTYLKKYTNEAVNNVVVAIRDILNPNNNEFRWIPDEVVLSKEEILQKIQDINNDCDTMNDKDYSIIAHRLQKLKVDRSVLLNIIKSMKDTNEQLIITVNGLLSKVDSVIRYYDNYLKQFNITPNTQEQNNKIVIHDVSEKFKFSADNIKFDN